MAPFYRGYQKDFQLASDDVMGIQQLYGVPKQPRSGRSFGAPGPAISADTLCTDSSMNAIFTSRAKETFMFKGNLYYKIEEWGIGVGYPRVISQDWYPLKGPVDCAFHWANGYTYFFKGSKYYKFFGRRFLLTRSISDGFPGIPNNVDAAFIWGANNATYFLKGDLYWRYTVYGGTQGYPKPLRNWAWNMPSRVDAAVRWTNGRTYFFKDSQYYRYNDWEEVIEDSYPRPTAPWWFGCPSNQMIHDSHQIQDLNGAPEEPIPGISGGQSEFIQVANYGAETSIEMSTDRALSGAGNSNGTIESPLEPPENDSDLVPDSLESVGKDSMLSGFNASVNNSSRNLSIRLCPVNNDLFSLYSVLAALAPSFLLRSGS
ncbi:hypothetical protein EGW08_021878 [Elysia chlorotica]|uniref:Hemopexin n=1 Tax=Elysia chlorotica TaxID=188477 RepID=A0A3S0ZAC4_ELYCH|nr:hypothetical protein EGW08_021878 [Elysia chlorotica]